MSSSPSVSGCQTPFVCSNGDLTVSNAAYNAVIDTLLHSGSFGKDFAKICSHQGLGPPGCAMLAVKVYGAGDKDVSNYYYQPASSQGYLAYANSIYNKAAFAQLIPNPPTVLVQSYYNCTMTEWRAFYSAAGLAKSNAEAYIAIAFGMFITGMLYFVNMNKKAPEVKVAPTNEKVRVVDGGKVEYGAKVQANYQDKGKWFPGKIKRVHGDGTVDIEYDDAPIPTTAAKLMKAQKKAEENKKTHLEMYILTQCLVVHDDGHITFDFNKKAELKKYYADEQAEGGDDGGGDADGGGDDAGSDASGSGSGGSDAGDVEMNAASVKAAAIGLSRV